MIKKILFVLLVVFTTLGLSAKTYKVYSVSGNISKKEGAKWNAIPKSAQISDADVIKINPASQIRLMDMTNRQVYTFSNSGEFKLSDLISKSDRDNKSLVGKISAESKKQMAAKSTKSHQALGAAHRATLDEEVLEALYASLVSGFTEGKTFGNLSVEKKPQEEGLFYLSITNHSSEPEYVNIFIKSEDSPWQAIYKGSGEESAILIAPESTVDINYMLLADDEDYNIAVVGFDQLFEADELNDMFDGGFEPQDSKADNVSIFFVK